MCRVSLPSPIMWNTTLSSGTSKYIYTSIRRSWVCAGIVFHTLPGSSTVMPMDSWHVGSTSGWMNWLITRLLLVSIAPSGFFAASSILMSFVSYARCAGADTM